jgi:hypothetical protein
VNHANDMEEQRHCCQCTDALNSNTIHYPQFSHITFLQARSQRKGCRDSGVMRVFHYTSSIPQLLIICLPHGIDHNTRDHDSILMSNLSQSTPQTPSGIDPEVLSKIEALFETPEAIVTPSPRRLPTEPTEKMEAWWTNTEAPLADRKVVDEVAVEEQHEGARDQKGNEEQSADVNSAVDEEDDFEFSDTDFFNPTSEDDIVSNIPLDNLDNLLPPESAPVSQSSPKPVDPRAPKIVARYIYPSEHQPGPPPPVPLQPGRTWPTLPYMIGMIYRFVVELIKDIFCASGPMIIEYSEHQIRQNANEVRVETQAVEFEVPPSTNTAVSAPETVVGVVALLHVGHDDQREAIPIIAKPKRVRQLLTDSGWNSVEDLYGNQIRVALKELSGMTGALIVEELEE